MKRTFFTFLMLLLISTAAFSQAQIGVRAGANWATIVNGMDTPEGLERPWRPGITIGLASSFQFGETFAIAPELNYSQRCERVEGSFGGANIEVESRYNFLEVPVLFRLSFGEVLKGYVNAGPTFSYWLGGKISEEDIDFNDEDFNGAKRLELGASIGGGVQLDTEIASFLIDLRYTRGFNNLIDDLSGDEEFKNQLIGVSLIALFPSAQ